MADMPRIKIYSGNSKVRLQRDRAGHLAVDNRVTIHMIPQEKIKRAMKGDRISFKPIGGMMLIDVHHDCEYGCGDLRVTMHGKVQSRIMLGPDESVHHIQIIRGDEKLSLRLEFNYGLTGPMTYSLEPEEVAPVVPLPERAPLPAPAPSGIRRRGPPRTASDLHEAALDPRPRGVFETLRR